MNGNTRGIDLVKLSRSAALLLALGVGGAAVLTAQDKKPAPDVIVLTDGDTLHGKLVSAAGGKIVFHTDALGDVPVALDKVKELKASGQYAVLATGFKFSGRKNSGQVPTGSIEANAESITVHPAAGGAEKTVAVKDTAYVVDEASFDKQRDHSPGFMQGWNGAATLGATLVSATQNQYTVSGGLGMVRVVPTVPWLNPHERTSFNVAGSYGKITEPAYTSDGVYTPSTTTKSSILHADAEQDEFFSPRVFALVQAAFDHNYSQDLDLQQIYGGGIGWTVLKKANQQADAKGTIQYEKQQFISGASGTNTNLVGSTFALNYVLREKFVTFTQALAYIPAYNDMSAYSVNETNVFAFPAYKNLSFSVGTFDSYLNNPPASEPPTKRNSFQFTMGLSYAIKSKY